MAQAARPVRISDSSRQVLRQLAKQKGESMQTVLDKAVEEYRRAQMFADADAAFAALKSDPEAWAEEQRERELWAGTLQDGLERDEVWPAEQENK